MTHVFFPLWKALFFFIFLVIPNSSMKPQLKHILCDIFSALSKPR